MGESMTPKSINAEKIIADDEWIWVSTYKKSADTICLSLLIIQVIFTVLFLTY